MNTSRDPWDLHDWFDREATDIFTPQEKFEESVIQHMQGVLCEAWHENDEPRYVAALLAAGAEPMNGSSIEHQAWQLRACNVLMQKYRHHWWYEWTKGGRKHPDPDYRRKAGQCMANVQLDELHRFYTWVCKQRSASWTNRFHPEIS